MTMKNTWTGRVEFRILLFQKENFVVMTGQTTNNKAPTGTAHPSSSEMISDYFDGQKRWLLFLEVLLSSDAAREELAAVCSEPGGPSLKPLPTIMIHIMLRSQ